MSSTKAALKAAKAAIDSQSWAEAVSQAEKAVAVDPQNYLANVFLGRGLDGAARDEEAAKAYLAATRIKENEASAWQGLLRLYEKQGKTKLDGYRHAALRLAEIHMAIDDKDKCQGVIDKFVRSAKEHGTPGQHRQALELLLPTSSIYDFLEGRIPRPADTYTSIASIVETEEKERINKEIGERRTRLGAKVAQVTEEVRREVLGRSTLEHVYQGIIDWSGDDEVRRQYEEKLLRHAYDTLIVLPSGEKPEKRTRVVELARGMVIIKHPCLLAWDITLEWADRESIADHDVGILREYASFFPDDGLSKVLRGYLESEISPFPLDLDAETQEDGRGDTDGGNEKTEHLPLSGADRLVLMTDGLEAKPNSALAGRLMGEYYLFLEEYESAVETSRAAKKRVGLDSLKTGLKFENTLDAINVTLAASLIYYDTPRNHVEAKALFEEILKRKPSSTPALIGVGLISEEQEDFSGAIDFLARAIERDPDNTRIRAEAAWCQALAKEYKQGLAGLQACLPQMNGTDTRARELRALTLYRVGICLWELDATPKARKDRQGAYSFFLASLQASMQCAPAYTSLGIYYMDYAKDKKRARKCFQKAFELSPSEIDAAERLARNFADQGEWDLVEIVAQRVVDSGRAKPTPGSKKKGVSWPFAALGVAELNKQDYAKSVASFQAALRISPDDYHSWVGLGESYHNSGRYLAATKAFQQAAKLDAEMGGRSVEETWFAMYMLANVKRELGDFDQAIEEYQLVLESRPDEFGVQIALLQTLVEGAWRSTETGFFGKAVRLADRALEMAETIAETRSDAFNLWKAVADACSIFSLASGAVKESPLPRIQRVLSMSLDQQQVAALTDVDGVGMETVESLGSTTEDATVPETVNYLLGAILANKRAVHTSANNVHAQAVAWYNLGWAEHHASHRLSEQGQRVSNRTERADPKAQSASAKHRKAAVRSCRHAIELEAGNSEFWNALGVVTSGLNPKVSQHSFIRSLHLNDKNARVWTNLGALYVLQEDLQLANEAFTRAQSTDPDYAPAWVGQGLLAQHWGDSSEAHSLYTHAFEIADSSSVLAHRLYAASSFDRLSSSKTSSSSIQDIVQPLFALQQLQSQIPNDLPHQHLSALYLERIGNYALAGGVLNGVYSAVEQDYEVSDSPTALARSAITKADLARVQLALGDEAAATEAAETAVQFSDPTLLGDDEISDGLSDAARHACRLSAHLTLGLASSEVKTSTEAFSGALAESPDDPDVIALLSQARLTSGGPAERAAATKHLHSAAQSHPHHLTTLLLLGAIAVVDNDVASLKQVVPQLHALRANVGSITSTEEESLLLLLLTASATLLHANDPNATLSAIQSEIALGPSTAPPWSLLARFKRDSHAADMALRMSQRAVASAPPGTTDVDATTLAIAFSGTGQADDAQRAVVLAPWASQGWTALSAAITT